jgi:hypothetical protein
MCGSAAWARGTNDVRMALLVEDHLLMGGLSHRASRP